MAGLLDGVVVLELGNGVPVGYAGRVLRSLGAAVVKVEAAEALDDVRTYGASCRRHAPLACSYWHLNGAKARIVLEGAGAERTALLARWMANADITIAGGGPLGIEVAAASALPVAANASFVRIVGATTEVPGVVLRPDESAGVAAGMRDIYGAPRPPDGLRFDLVEINAGVKAAATASLALVRSNADEGPARVDIGVYEAAFSAIEIAVQTTLLSQQFDAASPDMVGSPLAAPNVCADGGSVLINIYGRGVWERACRAMDRPDLDGDARFMDTFARYAFAPELREVLDNFCAKHDRDTVIARLWGERIPSAPILAVGELVQDPQVQARGIVRDGRVASCYLVEGDRDPLTPAGEVEAVQALAHFGGPAGHWEEGLHAVRVAVR